MSLNNKLRALTSLLLTFALAVSLGVSGRSRAQESAPLSPGSQATNSVELHQALPGRQSWQTSSGSQATNSVELHQALLDLTNPWTVMCIAAHPDDEDGRSLIVMRRKYGVHTVSVFSTFGEGGQNAIGPELYEELGAIRVRETMAAAESQGSEPYFLGLKDFGYSKSADEAFRVWGHDEALRRMVRKIRELRPDVIITNHDTTSGHGHHQATGRLELEAFDAAADPKRFPEQLRWDTQPWQVQRLFVRAGFGGAAANRAQQADRQGGREDLVTIDPNERDPIRGTIYAEQALAALQKHATQGPWPKTIADQTRNSPDGRLPLIRYRLTREAKGAAALPRDSHNFFDGLRLPDNIASQLQPPTIEGRPLTDFVDERDRVLMSLLQHENARIHAGSTIPEHWRLLRMGLRFSSALGAASGLSVKLIPRANIVEAGSTTAVDCVISNAGKAEVQPSLLSFGGGYTDGHVIMHAAKSPRTKIAPGSSFSASLNYDMPAASELTLPHAAHLYDGWVRGYPLAAEVSFEIGDVRFGIIATASVDVAPQIEFDRITPSPVVLTPNTYKEPIGFSLQLVNHSDREFSGVILVKKATGDAELSRAAVKLGPHNSKTVTHNLVAVRPNDSREMSSLVFQILSTSRSRALIRSVVPVVYTNAVVSRDLRVGYVRGFDSSLPNALAALGVESKELTIDDVRAGDLKRYDTIIIDNRVFESQPELIAANQRLLDYAKDGGTLIVFYHKSNEWNPNPRLNRPQLAPYPLILGDERITDENAPVTFTEAEHPLLNSPNKIGLDDFGGWIQERGLYYPKEWESHYRALLSTNDPGEQPLRGGLLVADYGRGHYIYTSMVWYRQLRAGVPGAYRMFANMISYGH